MNESKELKIALVDDHQLLRNALGALIDGFEECKVIHQSSNGREFVDYLSSGAMPDVVILDLNMPELDGLNTALLLQKNFPTICILMLTMYDSELSLIRLLQAGVKGFLKKDIHPSELKFAIHCVVQNGYYYSNHTTGKLINLFKNSNDSKFPSQSPVLADHELRFLKLACSDLTYKEIAQKMKLNPRSVDNLRDQLFLKLDVRSRVGLVITAIKNGIGEV
jgi:DNA-binding NarL/FixJ family response regulator